MFTSRRTLGVLAMAVASLGTLGVAAGPAAADGPLTITSVKVNGHDLAASQGDFFTNDTTHAATVTVTGDQSGSDITLNVNGVPLPDQTPVGGVATFTIPAPAFTPAGPGGDTALEADQTVGGTPNTAFSSVTTDIVPALAAIIDGDTYTPANLDFSTTNGMPGAGAELFVDGTQVGGLLQAASDGSTQSPTLADPPAAGHYHTAYVKSVDADHNESDASTPVGFYVAPAVPTIQSPVSTPDSTPYFNIGQPVVTVTGVDPGATVDLYELDDSGTPGSSLDSVTSTPGGTVALTPSSPLADGFHTFLVTQTVTEGTGPTQQSVTSDVYDDSAQTTVDIERSAPQISADVLNDPYAPFTSNNRPRFGAYVRGIGPDATAKVQFIDAKSGSLLGETGQYGSWVPSTPLADGTYSVYAVAIDDFGHVGTAHSATVDFTVDTSAPAAVSFTSPTDGSTVTTSVPNVTVHGEAGTNMCLGVDISPDAQEADVVCQTADANGNATITPDSVLSNGAHSLSVTSLDEAGNSSAAHATITVNTAGATPTQSQTPASTPPHAALTSVKLSSHSVSASHPVKVGFVMSMPGTVVLTLTKTVKTTVKQKVKITRNGKTTLVTKTVHKTVTKVVGTVRVKVTKAGHGSYTVTTKFAGHKLAHGKYTLSLKTTSAKSTSKPVTQSLSVS